MKQNAHPEHGTLNVNPKLARLKKLSWLLDRSLPLPGGLRIGIDGIIGIVPVIGDLVGACLSFALVAYAIKLNAPRTTILRMLINIAIDTLVGFMPILGDVFDFFWQANQRNIKLLEQHLAQDDNRG